MSLLAAEPVEAEAYRPYGDVIEAARPGAAAAAANQGTADRYDRLVDLVDKRPGKARPNLSVFRCAPVREIPVPVTLLERHPHSTQVFLPLSESARFLAVVALGGDEPDLSTLRAFLVAGPRGVSYRPGVWHRPMTVLGRETDMACLVWEDGTQGDCELRELKPAFRVKI